MLIYTRRRILKILDEWIEGHQNRIHELESEDPEMYKLSIQQLEGAILSFRGLKDELIFGRKALEKENEVLEDL